MDAWTAPTLWRFPKHLFDALAQFLRDIDRGSVVVGFDYCLTVGLDDRPPLGQ